MRIVLMLAFGLAALAPRLPALEVRVELDFQRLARIASNQLALWVEDDAGRHVRTLFVTDFTARRHGFARRPQSLPEWVRLFDPAHRDARELDAVSGATPRSGHLVYRWECVDEHGEPVADGAYVVKIEGSLSWERRVLWSIPVAISGGTVECGVPSVVALPAGEHSSEESAELIASVRAIAGR